VFLKLVSGDGESFPDGRKDGVATGLGFQVLLFATVVLHPWKGVEGGFVLDNEIRARNADFDAQVAGVPGRMLGRGNSDNGPAALDTVKAAVKPGGFPADAKLYGRRNLHVEKRDLQPGVHNR